MLAGKSGRSAIVSVNGPVEWMRNKANSHCILEPELRRHGPIEWAIRLDLSPVIEPDLSRTTNHRSVQLHYAPPALVGVLVWRKSGDAGTQANPATPDGAVSSCRYRNVLNLQVITDRPESMSIRDGAIRADSGRYGEANGNDTSNTATQRKSSVCDVKYI